MTRLFVAPILDALPLRTARLTLRRLEPADAGPLARMLADPDVMRHFPRPLARDEADAWLARNIARYEIDGTGLFAVCLDAEWIGDCGLVVRRIDSEAVLELGYHLRRDRWARGYAVEAAAACVELASRLTSVPAVTALIRPENVRSRRVAGRLGFAVRGAVVHAGVTHERWQRPRMRLPTGDQAPDMGR